MSLNARCRAAGGDGRTNAQQAVHPAFFHLFQTVTRRRAVDYWSYVGVTPDRDGVEWSPGRCKVFSTTGLPAFPVNPLGSHNDYSKYAESFPNEAMAEATVDANYAKQFL